MISAKGAGNMRQRLKIGSAAHEHGLRRLTNAKKEPRRNQTTPCGLSQMNRYNAQQQWTRGERERETGREGVALTSTETSLSWVGEKRS